VDEEVAQQPSECVERLVSLLLSLGLAQSKRGGISPPKDDIMIGQVCDDLVGLTQELREGSLNHTHGPTISEVLQKSTD